MRAGLKNHMWLENNCRCLDLNKHQLICQKFNFKQGSLGYQCEIKPYPRYKQCKLPVCPEEVNTAGSRYTDERRGWISWNSDRQKCREREEREGRAGVEEGLTPSVPALAQWEDSGTRRGGKHGGTSSLWWPCKTGRSPYDPVSVVGSAAAQAREETLAYTRLTALLYKCHLLCYTLLLPTSRSSCAFDSVAKALCVWPRGVRQGGVKGTVVYPIRRAESLVSLFISLLDRNSVLPDLATGSFHL